MDYFLSDVYLDPPGEHDGDFSEKLLRLDHSHFCYTPSARALKVKNKWRLHSPVVFGSFNNFNKITDEMLVAWKEILERTPGSVILCKNGGGKKAKSRLVSLRKKVRKAHIKDER